jgi:hypothetical protein
MPDTPHQAEACIPACHPPASTDRRTFCRTCLNTGLEGRRLREGWRRQSEVAWGAAQTNQKHAGHHICAVGSTRNLPQWVAFAL